MQVDDNRVKIWQALSTLFLDTEADDTTFSYIARVVLETGYSRQEVHHILWGEVFPVLKSNLRSIAGEWAGWPDEWLVEHLRPCTETVRMPKGFHAVVGDQVGSVLEFQQIFSDSINGRSRNRHVVAL